MAAKNGDILQSTANDTDGDSDSFFDAEESSLNTGDSDIQKSAQPTKNMQSGRSETSLHDSDSSVEYTYEDGKVKGTIHSNSDEEDLDSFEMSGPSHIHIESQSTSIHPSPSGDHEIFEEANYSFDNSDSVATTTSKLKITISAKNDSTKKEYRTSLPSVMFSRDEFSLWSILKQCIGKELSKITMPVIFNEPLSFLQRVCEYMEYTKLLKKASDSDDSLERMQYVATFCVSALASQLGRVGKPYNPLLGETFELKRPDLGFHWISEQVSHHPPISAFRATDMNNKEFEFGGSVWPKLKFWGKSVQIEPKGIMTLKLKKHNETYTWCNPMCSVHNVVVGTPWIEQYGDVKIVNHRTGEKCNVHFKAVGWFKGELNKVEAEIHNKQGTTVRHLEGDWTKLMFSLSPSTHKEYTNTINPKNKKGQKKSVNIPKAFEVLQKMSNNPKHDCLLVWAVQPRPECSDKVEIKKPVKSICSAIQIHEDNMYNMTEFAMSLNELKPSHEEYLPPTDTRFRPDIRAQETGDIDKAGEDKHKLEEKQRHSRRIRAKKNEDFTPRWFTNEKHPNLESKEWFYNGKYDQRNWEEMEPIEWLQQSTKSINLID